MQLYPISRKIRESQAAFGQNTRRREDRIRELEGQYDQVQQKILEIDGVIRAGERQASRLLNVESY